MIFESRTVVTILRLSFGLIIAFGLVACGGWDTHASSQSVRNVDGKGLVGKALAESAAKSHENDRNNWCDGPVVQDHREAEVRVEANNKDGQIEKNIEHKVSAAHKCL